MFAPHLTRKAPPLTVPTLPIVEPEARGAPKKAQRDGREGDRERSAACGGASSVNWPDWGRVT